MQKIKELFSVGIILLLPFIIGYFILKMMVGFTSSWEELFIKFGIEEYYFSFVGILITFLAVMCIGFFITSDFIHGIVGRVLRITRIIPLLGPFAEKSWLMMRGLAKRIIFISKGGYKRVIYEQHGKGHGRWRPAFVIGKTIFKYQGREKPMLVIITPQLQIPDPVWIAPEETRIVAGGIGSIGLLILSGGFVNPDELVLEDWTKEKYDEIPEYEEKETVKPTETNQDNNGGGK